jgi:hypothetical protein
MELSPGRPDKGWGVPRTAWDSTARLGRGGWISLREYRPVGAEVRRFVSLICLLLSGLTERAAPWDSGCHAVIRLYVARTMLPSWDFQSQALSGYSRC